MSHNHITTFEILEVLERRKSPTALLRRGMAHLHEICPECAQFFSDAQAAARRRQESGAPHQYQAIFDRLEHQAVQREARIEEDRRRSSRELALLRGLSSNERRERIEKAVKWYRSPIVAELLVAEARELLFRDPSLALERLEEAGLVARRLASEVYGPSICTEIAAKVKANRANALRTAGELRGAESMWTSLRTLLRQHPVMDPELCAEFDSLEASLKQDQGLFSEAEALLKRAAAGYSSAKNSPGASKVLIQRAILHRLQGQPHFALEALDEASHHLKTQSDNRLEWTILHNKALCLCEIGRYKEAEAALAGSRDFPTTRSSSARTYLELWLEGRIAAGLMEWERAERCLTAARNGLVKQRRTLNAALASLDLARIYLIHGQTYEVKRLASQTLKTFERQSIQAEMALALNLFLQAATAETLTLEALAELQAKLEAARRAYPTAIR